MLNFKWEEAKQKLSRIPRCTISIPHKNEDIEIEVTRKDLEEICAHIFVSYTKEIQLILSERKVTCRCNIF